MVARDAIARARSGAAAQAAAILGPRYAVIVVRDGWAPYRKLPQATHQTCPRRGPWGRGEG